MKSLAERFNVAHFVLLLIALWWFKPTIVVHPSGTDNDQMSVISPSLIEGIIYGAMPSISSEVSTVPEATPKKVVTISSVMDGDRLAFCRRFGHVALEEQRKYGIPASITLAQGILESRSGTSKLAVSNNNYFGVKCHSSTCGPGHCSNFTDDSHKDFFRIYATAWESFRAHSVVLAKKERYSYLFLSHPPDLTWEEIKPSSEMTSRHAKEWQLAVKHWDTPWLRWAHGLEALGYATSPDYAEGLAKLIREHQLQLLDDPATATIYLE